MKNVDKLLTEHAYIFHRFKGGSGDLASNLWPDLLSIKSIARLLSNVKKRNGSSHLDALSLSVSVSLFSYIIDWRKQNILTW